MQVYIIVSELLREGTYLMTNFSKPPCDQGIILSSDAPAAESYVCKAGPWVLAATILGSSMAFIDGTVVNVALPVLQRDFHISVAQLQWVVEAYALILASLILVGGSLGDLYGRRRIFAIGVIIFALASAGCGLSSNIVQLIIARAIQGVGGALLVPGSLSLISASFDTKQRGRAIGKWSGSTSITSALGPVLGGWLVQYTSWRWVFFLNIPLALAVLLLLWRVPESHNDNTTGRLDWWGALLVTLALSGIVYGLTQVSTLGFVHPVVLLSLVIGALLLCAFLFLESRIASPMLPLKLFKSSTFVGANLLTLLLYAGLGGALFFLPFNLIQVQHYSPTSAGAALLPFILIMFLLSSWSGGLVVRYGPHLPLIIGPIIAGGGFALFALPGIGGSYWLTYFPAVLVLGLGMAISVAPLTTVVMEAVSTQFSGIASGVNNAVSRTAGLLAIAILSIVMVSVFATSFANDLTSLPLSASQRLALSAQTGQLTDIRIPTNLSPVIYNRVLQAVDIAFIAGFRVVMLIAAALALASALCAWLLIEPKKTVNDGLHK